MFECIPKLHGATEYAAPSANDSCATHTSMAFCFSKSYYFLHMFDFYHTILIIDASTYQTTYEFSPAEAELATCRVHNLGTARARLRLNTLRDASFSGGGAPRELSLGTRGVSDPGCCRHDVAETVHVHTRTGLSYQ